MISAMAALAHPCASRHLRGERESRYLADIINERLIAIRQGLQREHLAARVRAHRDAVRDRVAQKLIHRSAFHGIGE